MMRSLSAHPAVQNDVVYRGIYRIGEPAADQHALVNAAHDCMLEWLDERAQRFTGKSFKKLPGEDLDALTWQIQPFGGFGAQIAQDVDHDRYAIRAHTPDQTFEQRRWIVNACTFIEDGRATLEVQLNVNSIDVRAAVTKSVPGLVYRIRDQLGLVDVVNLAPKARFISVADIVAFRDLLVNRDRRLPVVAISQPTPLNVDEIAHSLLGVSHIAVLSTDASFALTDLVGKHFSVYAGAVRTYRPGLNLERDDPFGHPLALGSSILNYRDNEGNGAAAYARVMRARTFDVLVNGLAHIAPRDQLWIRRVSVEDKRLVPDVALPLEPPADTPAIAQPNGAIAPPAPLVPTAVEAEDLILLREELQAAQAREDDAVRRANEAVSQAQKFENDYYELLGELEGVKRELEVLKANQVSSLDFSQSTSLPGVKDLLRGLESLMRGVHGVVSDVAYVERERDEARTEAARLRIAFESSPERTEPVVPTHAYPRNYESFEALEEYCAKRYEGRLLLHPRVRDSWSRGQYEDFDHLFAVLDSLGDDFHALRQRSPDDAQAHERYREKQQSLNIREGAAISDAEFGKYSADYEVEWHGKPVRVDRHLRSPRHGSTVDPRRVLAVYYFWDEEAQATVITGMPGHARNRFTP